MPDHHRPAHTSARRERFVDNYLKSRGATLSPVEAEVIKSLRQNEVLAKNTADVDAPESLGERLSDHIASFGGSWTFLISFFLFLFSWISVNSIAILIHPVDPYPYILLNLVLSCLASVQAPIILMSQKRQEDKDRQRAEHDYQVNLKAELEIRYLHEKLNELMQVHWDQLIQMQRQQLELLDALNKAK